MHFRHSKNLILGQCAIMSKPKLEGKCDRTSIISTDCIYPQCIIFPLQSLPISAITENTTHFCYHFASSNYEIEDMLFSIGCNRSCNSRHLNSCYCTGKVKTSSWVIGINVSFDKLEEVNFETFDSRDWTNSLISEELILKKGKDNSGNSILNDIENHILTQLDKKGDSICGLVKGF